MAGKGLGKTVLGWFVVDENASASEAATPEELIAKYAHPEPPSATPAKVALNGQLPEAPLPGQSSAIDFAAVYRAAAISAEEQDRVTKTQGLLTTLPSDTPHEVKKQIVLASLKAFGVPIEQIIESGAGQIQALQAYIEHGQERTQTLLAESTARIEQLENEVAEIQRVMQQEVQRQELLTRTTNDEKLKVQTVLEFFGQEAIARVVKESPRLIEPR